MLMDYMIRIVRWIRYWLSKLYFNKDGSPKRCIICGCKEFNYITKDRIDYVETEHEINCKECGMIAGYWAYGCYDPAYIKDFVEIGELSADKETQCDRELDKCFGGGGDCVIKPITDFPTI